MGLPLPGLGPAPSGGLTTNSRRTRCRGHSGLPASSARASAATAQYEPSRATEQGDQAPVERRRRLPESRRRDTARGGDPAGTRRRMDGCRAPLLQRGVDAVAHDADLVEHGPGDLSGDCVADRELRNDATEFPPLDGTLIWNDLSISLLSRSFSLLFRERSIGGSRGGYRDG